MTNIVNKTKICNVCKKEKSLSEFYKRYRYYKNNTRPKLYYYKECKRCFIDTYKSVWQKKNLKLQHQYVKNSEAKKAGKLDKIDKSMYRGRLCMRPDRIEVHMERMRNKKIIEDFQSTARKLRKEKKQSIDDKYQTVIDDLSDDR